MLLYHYCLVENNNGMFIFELIINAVLFVV